MAAITTIVAVASLAVAAVGTYSAIQAQGDAKDAARDSKREQDKIKAENQANNAGKAAAERRQQIREERVKRARIIQASTNSGTAESSGEFGALGGLSTSLGANLGANAGALRSADRVSGYAQNAADLDFKSRSLQGDASNYNQLAGFAGNIFQASGGWASASRAGSIFDTVKDNSIAGTAGSGSRGMAD